MAVRAEKNGEQIDIVISGYEKGVAASPHLGIAMLKNANLSTETGEVIPSFPRVLSSMTDTASTGSLTYQSTNTVNLSISGSNNKFSGQWITVSNSSNTGELPNGNYYVGLSNTGHYQLNTYYNTLNPSTNSPTASYLIVGGGGGAGGTGQYGGPSGGGGGGQVKSGSTAISAGTYAVTVGGGGAGGVATTGTTGGNASSGSSSSAFSVTAAGGVGSNGGFSNSSSYTASNGGNSGSGQTGGTGSTNTTNAVAGGGGGGDSAGGTSASGGAGGNGGAGTASTITGTSVTYGGGGGGGYYNTPGSPGTGGAGGGADGTHSVAGNDATANTGGGGGGTGSSNGTLGYAGGAGGSGVVYIAYPTGSLLPQATGGTISYYMSGGVSYTLHEFTTSGNFVVPAQYSTTNPLTGFTAGLTATIALQVTMGKPIAKAIETYFSSGDIYYRYYILDANGYVWVNDSQNYATYGDVWLLPDPNSLSNTSGLAVLDGILIVSTKAGLYGKPTSLLGNTNSTATTFVQFPDITAWEGGATNAPHYCFAGQQGTLYVTDTSYILSVFPTTTIAALGVSGVNTQSLCSYVPSGNAGIYSVIAGASPATADGQRIPAVFFTQNTGLIPSALTPGTVYYIGTVSTSGQSFDVYSAATGGSAINLSEGAYGTQYFATFWPLASASASTGSTPTYQTTPQRMALPEQQVAQSLAEVGNILLIGTQSNVLYPWDQVSNLPNNAIFLPEANVPLILTVNNMGYIFAGNKGNIYLTDGSVASKVMKVPDYAAGIPGTQSSYIEPYFVWGDAAYVRGRVYFSLLDQTATKAGNCGGIWAFTPTQNFFLEQDVGTALHLENVNSYNTYDGYATVLIPNINQEAIAPQFYSGWQSTLTSPTYGIDATGTALSSSITTIIESDIIPIGTQLNKKSIQQIEQKFAAPIDSAATVAVNYRTDATGVWKTAGTSVNDSSGLSTYFRTPVQQIQWLQLQTVITPVSSGNFPRFAEQRIR